MRKLPLSYFPRREKTNLPDRHGFEYFPILTELNEAFIFMTTAIMAGPMSGYLFRS